MRRFNISKHKQKQKVFRQQFHSLACQPVSNTVISSCVSSCVTIFASSENNCAIRNFVRFSTLRRSTSMRCWLTCRGSGFFLGGIWGNKKQCETVKTSNQKWATLILKLKFLVSVDKHFRINNCLEVPSIRGKSDQTNHLLANTTPPVDLQPQPTPYLPTAKGRTSPVRGPGTGMKTPCEVLVGLPARDHTRSSQVCYLIFIRFFLSCT